MITARRAERLDALVAELPGSLAVAGDIAVAAAALSDRLAMRYFSHVGDVSRYTLAS